MSRDQLAEVAEISPGYVALLEQGHRVPGSSLVIRLAQKLHMSDLDCVRLLTQSAFDSVAIAMPALLSSPVTEFATAELVVDALIRGTRLPANSRLGKAAEAFERPDEQELQNLLSGHVAHALTRVVHRWGNTTLLGTRDYFERISAAMLRNDLAEVRAVNTIDARRWLEDPRERKYFEANEVASRRKKLIRRLFVINRADDPEALALVADEHARRGIVRVSWLDGDVIAALADFPEDAVLFTFGTDDGGQLFVGHPDPEDRVRVEFAEFVNDPDEMKRYQQYFDRMFASGFGRPEDALK